MRAILDLLRDAALMTWWMLTGLARRFFRWAPERLSPGRLRQRRLNSRSLKRMTPRSDQPVSPGRATPTRATGRRAPWYVRAAGWAVAFVLVYGAAAILGSHAADTLLENQTWKPPVIPGHGEGGKFKEGSSVLASDGDLVYSFSEENREYITHDQISPFVLKGLVAVEDEQFYSHIGLNFRGLARAALADIKASIEAGAIVMPQGGSSLTQQLAKMLFLKPEKKLKRKAIEALYALHIEQEYSKEEILQAYLNLVFLGHNRYGVEAASQFYFGKPCKDLTLAEGALIAGIPQRPSDLSPLTRPGNAKRRRDHVLDRMADSGFITQEECDSAKAEPIVTATKETEERTYTNQVAPFFVEDVRRELLDRAETRDVLTTGGLTIETTLDMDLQRKATKALRDGLRRIDKQLKGGFRPIERNLLAEGKDPEEHEDPIWLLPAEADDVVPGVVMEADDDSAIVRIGDDRVQMTREGIAWTRRKSVSDTMRRGDVAPFRVLRRDETSGRIERIELEQDPLLEGALIAIDVTSGEVLAMAGGFDYNRSEFNKATQAMRAAGSSFKPIYYASALEKGLRPSTTTMDEPTTFVDAWTGEFYQPENYYKNYSGRLTLRESLELSLNIPSVRILNYIGYDGAIATARKFGITATLQPYPSMALGATDLTLLEITSAYAAFPNGGMHVRPTLLRRVRDAKGEVLYQHQAEAEEVVSPQVAWQMVQLLRGVVQSGTAKEAKSLGRAVAGKTGTTDDYTDAWFVGFTPSLAVGVWTGHEKGAKPIGKDYTGARAALPIWIDFMEQYFQGRPEEQFIDPGGIEMVAIDRKTGLVASEDCPPENVFLESFVEGNRPVQICSSGRHRALTLPRCLQQYGMDESGTLVVPDEKELFALEGRPEECPIRIDPIERMILFSWSPLAPAAQYSYRVGASQGIVVEDSIEALMMADRRTTRDGLLSDFSVVDGRTVIVVRNDNLGPGR